jgi:hypothetical protein
MLATPKTQKEMSKMPKETGSAVNRTRVVLGRMGGSNLGKRDNNNTADSDSHNH